MPIGTKGMKILFGEALKEFRERGKKCVRAILTGAMHIEKLIGGRYPEINAFQLKGWTSKKSRILPDGEG